MKGDAPDWWGEIPSVPTGLTEDRYVAALEIKEVNDVDSHERDGNRATVGGRFVFHHMIWRTQVLDADKSRPARIRWRSSSTRRRSTGRCTKWAATPTSSIRSRRAC